MKPPKFRIVLVECCYTCGHAEASEGSRTCKYHWFICEFTGRRIHGWHSAIGKCKRYYLKPGIGPSSTVDCADNIHHPDEEPPQPED